MEISMGKVSRTLVALLFGATALGFTAASAEHRDRDDVEAGIRLSVTVGDNYDDRSYGGRYDDDYYDGRRDGRYDGRRRGDRYDDRYDGRRGSRVVKRRVYDTRWRARIYLVEEIFFGGGRSHRVCTLDVRGPDSRFVSSRHVRRIANNECHPRARVRYR
jgi:hypothetical protein